MDYPQKERLRRPVMQAMHELFSTVDVLFGPTYGSYDLFMTANFTGHPDLTLRAGFVESPSRQAGRMAAPPADRLIAPRQKNTRPATLVGH